MFSGEVGRQGAVITGDGNELCDVIVSETCCSFKLQTNDSYLYFLYIRLVGT